MNKQNVREQNQQHPQLSKKKRVDAQGNDKRRFFVESGNATLMIAKGLTKPACDILASKIVNAIEDLGGKCTCNFVKFK